MFFSAAELLICATVVCVLAVMSAAGALEKLELRMYDVLLSVKPEIPQHKDVVIAAIDDAAIGEMGTFPWTRDILADVLIRLKELGAFCTVFDIEYISPSHRGIDPAVENSLPAQFRKTETELSGLMRDFAAALAQGDLPARYAPDTAEDLISSYLEPELRTLQLSAVDKLSRDNDEYFAQAIHFFANTWLTINAGDVGIDVSEELKNYVRERFLLKNVTEPAGLIARENDLFFSKQHTQHKMTPALLVLMQQARGAGFTNIILDSDGTRRRIELLHETDGLYIPQLVFAPLLDVLQTHTIIRTPRALIVKQALFPGENVRRDISVPLDGNGRMLINWVPTTFRNSFKNESVLFLCDLDKKERTLIDILHTIGDFRLGKNGRMLSYYDAAQYLSSVYDDLQSTKTALVENVDSEIPAESYANYFERRSLFFQECAELTDPSYEREILATLDEIRTAENAAEIEDISLSVSDKFAKFASYLGEYTALFDELSAVYDNAFCIIGHTASNSTDLGTTPFERQYPNIGTHANVFNTIINESFIVPVPSYFGFILTAVLIFIVVLFALRLPVSALNIIGAAGIIAVPLASFILIRFNIYSAPVAPFLTVVLCYVGASLYRFASAEKDKAFLRRAFSTYLSEDVVAEIVSDPSKLSLGGKEKNITALFTDIKSFSTLSEKLPAERLVAVLNDYLTALSNIILEHKGTIDKYIGDAIVSFFGAPVDLEDHAYQACLTAVRMKKAEQALNEQLSEQGKLPMLLHTRIGINTGTMVVGNMGTDMKMNYTIMGNDVNLAARLEGVNKVYGSWILISESTWNAANAGKNEGKLLARRLDRVRVVGIEKPVRLYNLVGLKSELDGAYIECVNVFHNALECYEQKDFVQAKALFQKALALMPDDGPSSVFAARCDEFIKKGVGQNWDGVLTMTTK